MDPIVGVIDETKELSDRLEKARAARVAFDESESERKRLDTLRASVEAEERELANAQKLSELEQKYGPVDKVIMPVYVDTVMVVVKRANHMHMKRFSDTEDKKTDELKILVQPCLLYPTWSEFEKLSEDLPAMLTKAANGIAYLAGYRKADLAKK